MLSDLLKHIVAEVARVARHAADVVFMAEAGKGGSAEVIQVCRLNPIDVVLMLMLVCSMLQDDDV